jgi:hypothetical protein
MLLNFELWQRTFFDGQAQRFDYGRELSQISENNHADVQGTLYGIAEDPQPS